MRAYRDTRTEVRRQSAYGVAARHPHGAVLALQRLAGNRAMRLLLRADLDTRVPQGLSEATDARPLPAVAGLPGADTATVKADPWAGGWDDGGDWTYSGTVGTMERVLLDGLPGSQQEQPAQKVKPPAGAPPFAKAVGGGPRKQRGRAVAIVPPGVTKSPGPVAVVVHFHGNDVNSTMLGSMGMRSRGDRPEDVADFQIPQQLEAFVKSRPGARLVVLMPIGVTVPAGKGFVSSFGIGDLDAYVGACLRQLGLAETPAGVYLSGHSGGGFTISGLASGGLPKSVRGVFGFESFHDSDLGTWTQLVQDRLNLELKQLEAVRADRKAGGASEAAIATAQLEFLRDSGFRFAAFAGGSYAKRVRDIRTAIITWFDAPKTRRRLKAAMGGTINTDVLRQLWMNFQASDFAGSSHMNALSLDSHFGQVLASLAKVGPLAPSSPPAAPSPRPAGAAVP